MMLLQMEFGLFSINTEYVVEEISKFLTFLYN